MSEYQEFTGRTVEEAIRAARESFGVSGLDDLDFEILTPGSRGVLGMGAEPARIIAAPRTALGGGAPRRDAAARRQPAATAPHPPLRTGAAPPQPAQPPRDSTPKPVGRRRRRRQRPAEAAPAGRLQYLGAAARPASRPAAASTTAVRAMVAIVTAAPATIARVPA